MRRRDILIAGVAGAGLAALWARPGDQGGKYDAYFSALNDELKRNGPSRPCMVLDLDRLDQNIDLVTASIRAPKHYRIVAKSLPSLPLIKYVASRAGTQRIMSFHQPFLNLLARELPESDILLGKPMPVRSAEIFYTEHTTARFSPGKQLQWLIDTSERLRQYLLLAQALKLKMRVNFEIDVGLHRGGVTNERTLDEMLSLVKENPDYLEFSGFMGYDPHVVKLPRIAGSRASLFDKVLERYRGFVEFTKREHPRLWNESLTLNGAGSPTFRLYERDTLVNDLAVGSALVKPTDFDLDTLKDHQPAAFIATPVLKAERGNRLPGVEAISPLLSLWDRNRQQTFFVYGGRWMARFESPPGLRHNGLFGFSSNQEMVNGSAAVNLGVDDHVFLRPTQSEAVLLQFGDLVCVRDGKVTDHWPIFSA